MRLIDADELGRYLFSRFHFQRVELEDVIAAMADFADKNTIEAEPVRSGRWKRLHPLGWYDFECSECGETPTEMTKYCPNCGAKMNAKEELKYDQDT